MKEQSFILPQGKQALLDYLETLPTIRKWRVRVSLYKYTRSLDQNALSHAWYAEIARTEKEYTPAEVKRLCKYHFGIPILRRNMEYSEMIEKALGPLSYEERLKAMDLIKVSSVMKTGEMSTYLEHIQRHYIGRVNLEFPMEEAA